jgi:hypothetical protein
LLQTWKEGLEEDGRNSSEEDEEELMEEAMRVAKQVVSTFVREIHGVCVRPICRY